jgi:uracil phosphoribosyltransferase
MGLIVFAVMFFVGFTFVRNRNSQSDLVYKGHTLSVDEFKKAMSEIKELMTALSLETLQTGEIKTATTTELSTDFKSMMLLTLAV